MRIIVNNSSKKGVVSSIESVHDCVGNVCMKNQVCKLCGETRRDGCGQQLSSWATWAAVQYLCQNCRVKHIVQ